MSKKDKGLTAEFRPYIKWALGSNPFRKLVVSEESVTMERFEGADTTLRQPLDANAVQGFWKKRLNIGDIELSSTTGKKFTVANIRNVSHVVDLINNPSMLKEQFSDVAKVQPTELDARANDNAPAVKPYNPKPEWSRGLTDTDFSDRVVVIPGLPMNDFYNVCLEALQRKEINQEDFDQVFKPQATNKFLQEYYRSLPGAMYEDGEQMGYSYFDCLSLISPDSGMYLGSKFHYDEAESVDQWSQIVEKAYGHSDVDFFDFGEAGFASRSKNYPAKDFFRPLRGGAVNYVASDFVAPFPLSVAGAIKKSQYADVYDNFMNKPLSTIHIDDMPKSISAEVMREMKKNRISLPQNSVSKAATLDAPSAG